jgi:hypothetical protein
MRLCFTAEPVRALAKQCGGVSEAAISKRVHRGDDLRKKDRAWNCLLEMLEKQIVE